MMDGGPNGVNGGDTVMINAGPGPQWQMQQTVNPVAAAPEKPAAGPEPYKPFKQKITITKDGKKRVAPLLVST